MAVFIQELAVITVMRKTFINAILLIFFGNNSVAQNNHPPIAFVNQLSIEIIDVVERKQLSDLDLIICNENDTINIHVDSTDILIFDLKYPGSYSATVIKDGYDTLFIEFNNPSDSAELILEFYMPKTMLTYRDKRKAHNFSRDLPERPCDHCGGFQRISVAYNEMCVIRFREFVNGQASESAYEFRKLKYY